MGEPLDTPRATLTRPPVPWFLASRWRLLGTLCLTLALPMGALTFSLSAQVRRSLEAQAAEQNTVATRLAANAAREHFEGLMRYVESFARRPLLAALVQRKDAEGIRAHLKDLVTHHGSFDRAFITDSKGRLWSDYPHAPEVIGKNFSFRDWYRGVSGRRTTYVSEVYKRAAPPQPFLVAIATPIGNARQEPLGYLVAQHTLETLTTWLAQVRPSRGGAVALIDHHGVLAMTDPSGAGPPPPLGEHPVVRRALAGEAGSVVTADPLTGEPSLMSYFPVGPIGWVVLSRQPIAVVLAPVRALQRTIAGLALVCFAAMLTLGSFWLTTIQRYRWIEDARREAEEQFRTVAENATDAIVSADSRGNIVYFNRAAEGIFGYAAEEVRGRPLTLLMPERLHEAHRRGLERFLSTGEARVIGRTVELVGRRRDGGEFPVELSLSRWNGRTGTYFTGILRDVTERKRTEEEIARVNTQLAAANKELEAFTYTVSHDLKAPLRGMEGFARALAEDYAERLDEAGHRYLGMIRTSARRMGDLIDDLLRYSRLERRAIRRERVALRPMLEGIREELEEEIRRRGLTVRMELAEEGVEAEREGLREALANLIENGVKFNGEGGTVTVAARREDNTVILSVADTGIGFDLRYHDRIFRIFERLHRQEEYPGTGVGLAIVRKVAERHGGRAWAVSEPGKGSTFYLALPAGGEGEA